MPPKKRARMSVDPPGLHPAGSGTPEAVVGAEKMHASWEPRKTELPTDQIMRFDKTSGVKKEGGRTFVQQKCRGFFVGEPVCFFCKDKEQTDVDYEARKVFTMFPTYRLKPGYVRDEENDPKPVLDAKRKNAALNKNDAESSQLKAGDIVTKGVQMQAHKSGPGPYPYP